MLTSLQAHAAFDVLAPWWSFRGGDRPPDARRLNAIVDQSHSNGSHPVTATGARIRFDDAEPLPTSAIAYERSIRDTGCVPLRRDSWHDALNALCWIAWPQLKSSINCRHVLHGMRESVRRGPMRDALTLIDESGVVVLSLDPGLSALLVAREWKRLFCDQRAAVARSMRFLVCGHAVLDKLRSPYRSIAGRALIVDAPDRIVGAPIITQRTFADRAAAEVVLRDDAAPPTTVAFPLCAVPGWWAGNDRDEFYDDVTIFRPPNAAMRPGSASTDSHSASAPAAVSSSADP